MIAMMRAHEVLIRAHAARDAVHDDADKMRMNAHGLSRNGGSLLVSPLVFPCIAAMRRRAAAAHRAGDGQRAAQFLFPMGDLARRTVAVEQPQRRVADVGELMEHSRRNIGRLSARNDLPLRAALQAVG